MLGARVYAAGMHGLLYHFRGVQSWPETQALVTRVEELTRGGEGGDWYQVLFTYKPAFRVAR